MVTKSNKPGKAPKAAAPTKPVSVELNDSFDQEQAQAQQQIEDVKDRYLTRIEALVAKVSAAFEVNGWLRDGGFTDMTDCEYTFEQDLKSLAGTLGIRFSIMEATQWDGEPLGGINFRLDIGDDQGRQLDLIPYNFTSKIWVMSSDPAAVEKRFAELEALDPEELAAELYEQKGWVAANNP
jgi:hypothetical protein